MNPEMLRQEESQVFERKKSLALQREGFESLCGMVNSEGANGTVVFGVAPDGQVVGVESGNLDKAQRSLAQTISAKFDPPIQVSIEVVDCDGIPVVAISAQRHRRVPYHEFDGRAFIREGTATRQLSLREKQALERQRNRDSHNGPWRCDRCGSFVGMLSRTGSSCKRNHEIVQMRLWGRVLASRLTSACTRRPSDLTQRGRG